MPRSYELYKLATKYCSIEICIFCGLGQCHYRDVQRNPPQLLEFLPYFPLSL
jgi:hypothetical protein